MRARLLRSSLLAAAVAVLLLGLPLVTAGSWLLERQGHEELEEHAAAIHMVVAVHPGQPLATLRHRIESTLHEPGFARQIHVVVRAGSDTLEVGPEPTGATWDETVDDNGVTVVAELPQSAVWRQVTLLALVVLGLAVVAFLAATVAALVQARRLMTPLAALAENADRIGRGSSRLLPVPSKVAELDRVAAGLQRSADSMAEALAAERQFASDASHQLRTPLTALSMRLEEISTSTDLAQVREEARVALHQVERLTSVVDSLLSKARRGRGTAVPVELQTLLVQQVEEWSPAFAGRGRRLVLAPHQPVVVLATPSALSQVLATLIENSLQHGGGTVTITARRTGGSAVVEVTDEGRGVPASIGARVFEREVSSSGSTGVGLALARDLAEADGGRLELLRARPPVFALFLNAAELPA
ncbi:MAG TPA: HAMP domain-containing sensor histidine kinase [Actinomycetales bacterium]|nr:HAMP domain-containing sensor histidine kinase [Actinomycetales bacterium]